MGRAETRVQVTAVTGETAHMGPVTTHPDVGSDGRSDQVILDAVGLRKRFDETQAVDDVSIRIHRGERVGIVGPNGAGKTTTLLMLLGAIDPDEGTIDLAGCRLPDGRSRAMGRVGFAAGYLPLPAGLTVTETLELFGALYGVDDPSTRAAQVLDELQIASLAEQRVESLSSGQGTLVGFAKAVIHQPDLIVLDEPTASLDPARKNDLGAVLRGLAASGRTLLFTSHDVDFVRDHATRVLVLAQGEVVEEGDAREVLARPRHAATRELLQVESERHPGRATV